MLYLFGWVVTRLFTSSLGSGSLRCLTKTYRRRSLALHIHFKLGRNARTLQFPCLVLQKAHGWHVTWEAREGFSEFLIFLLGLGQCDKEGPQMNAEEDRPKVNREKDIYTWKKWRTVLSCHTSYWSNCPRRTWMTCDLWPHKCEY